MDCYTMTTSAQNSARLALVTTLAILVGCGRVGPLAPPITDCEAEHPMVGAVAELQTHHHDVAGTATVLDDCTIEITDFTFDGSGLDVRAILADNPDFDDFEAISEDLHGNGSYSDATITLPLREGMTLDDVG